MNLWDIKAKFYGPMRSSYLMKRIVRGEINNLKTLLDKAGLHPRIVLDLGTGVGSCLNIYPDKCIIIGLDRSLNMIREGLHRSAFAGLVGDAYRLPFRNESVSFVSAVGLTEYLRDKRLFLKEVKRILRRGGHFLVTTARPGIPNVLRYVLGHRLYPVQNDRWMIMSEGCGFTCLGYDCSFIQTQYLFRILPSKSADSIKISGEFN